MGQAAYGQNDTIDVVLESSMESCMRFLQELKNCLSMPQVLKIQINARPTNALYDVYLTVKSGPK
jgi:hypothetical protein